MDQERLNRNIDVFNLFINKITRIQFWVGVTIFFSAILLQFILNLPNYKSLLLGLDVISGFLIIESIYYLSKPLFIRQKHDEGKLDVLALKSVFDDKLKIFGVLLIGGIVFTLFCVFFSFLKPYIPIGVPIIILGSLQLVKCQIILFKSWILEDEINRL